MITGDDSADRASPGKKLLMVTTIESLELRLSHGPFNHDTHDTPPQRIIITPTPAINSG